MAKEPLTDQGKQDFDLAIEYLRSHPVISKLVVIVLDHVFDEIDELRKEAGLRKRNRKLMIKEIVLKARHYRKVKLQNEA